MKLDEQKMLELLKKWEHIPQGVEGDEVRVVLLHEATGICAKQLRDALSLPQVESSGDAHFSDE